MISGAGAMNPVCPREDGRLEWGNGVVSMLFDTAGDSPVRLCNVAGRGMGPIGGRVTDDGRTVLERDPRPIVEVRAANTGSQDNRLTLIAAEAAVDSNDYYVRNCRIIAENREYTVAALDELGFETTPSVANFIFSRCKSIKGKELYSKLKAKGVLVRHWDKPEIADYVRITIGSREQMDIFLARVQELLKEE